MKKFLLFTILLLQVSISFSQNYQCVQPGIKRYFIGTNHYLRGIRVDSVKMIGNASILYPFHSFRGDSTLDTNGGCWMGKSIVVNNDGTTWFNNFWNDTVIIKTQAALYDSWTFYNDTSQRNYTATVTSLDTMTVLGVLDSVKTITLTCKKGSSTLTTDAFHNAQIIISKNHGFVQTYDLDMFPLQKNGVDYLTDHAGWGQFNLVDFQNPSTFDFYDYNIGDVFKREYDPKRITLQTVIDKQILSPTQIQYTYFGYEQSLFPTGVMQTSVGTSTEKIQQSYFVDTTAMPEEWYYFDAFYYYNPYDTIFCTYGKYSITTGHVFRTPPMVGFGVPTGWFEYKRGLGVTYFSAPYAGPIISENLIGVYKGYICDSMPTLAIPETVKEQTISLYPNPSNGLVNIDNTAGAHINNISFYNVLGSKVYELNVREQKNEYTIQLPQNVTGVLYSIIKTDGGDVIKKLLVE